MWFDIINNNNNMDEVDDSEYLNFFVSDMEDSLDNNQFLSNNLQDRILYFHRWVRRLHDTGAYTLIEAIIDFADNHDLEYEDCTKLISPDLKSDIYFESVKNNAIKHSEFVDVGL